MGSLANDPAYQARMKVLNNAMEILMALPKGERQYFIQKQRVTDAENYLEWMINQRQQDADFVKQAVQKAQQALNNYELYNDITSLQHAELWSEIAQGTTNNMFTIANIRKQRERVQWEKRQLNQMRKPNSEHGQS